MEGLQVLAHLIDGIMSKIKISASDTAVRIRHTSETTGKTSVLTLNIPELEYHDETPGSEEIKNNNTAINWNPPILVKNLTFNGLNVEYVEEVTMGEAQDSDDDNEKDHEEEENDPRGQPSGSAMGAGSHLSETQFKSMMSSSLHGNFAEGRRASSVEGPVPTVILHAGNKDFVKVRLRQPSCTVNVPAIDVEVFLRLCYVCITAEQTQFLQELLNTLLPERSSSNEIESRPSGSLVHESPTKFKFVEDDLPASRPMGPADFEKVISKGLEDDHEDLSQESFDSVDLEDEEPAPKKDKAPASSAQVSPAPFPSAPLLCFFNIVALVVVSSPFSSDSPRISRKCKPIRGSSST